MVNPSYLELVGNQKTSGTLKEHRARETMPGKEWVRESRFGRWFLTTDIWLEYVLRIAIVDLKQLITTNVTDMPQILDIGCHQGMAFELLEEHFHPRKIIGVEIDREQIGLAQEAAKRCQCHVECMQGTVYDLDLPDSSIDLIFCHQLLHHLSDQHSALDELHRVLVPGGLILISESCRSFLNLLWVRLFFPASQADSKNGSGICRARQIQGVSYSRCRNSTLHSLVVTKRLWANGKNGMAAKATGTYRGLNGCPKTMLRRYEAEEPSGPERLIHRSQKSIYLESLVSTRNEKVE